MASNYDIAFLRVLMQQSLAEKAQAMRCIQVIDEQASRGQPVSAMQVLPRRATRLPASSTTSHSLTAVVRVRLTRWALAVSR